MTTSPQSAAVATPMYGDARLSEGCAIIRNGLEQSLLVSGLSTTVACLTGARMALATELNYSRARLCLREHLV